MLEYRRLSHEEYEDAAELSDDTFRDTEQKSMRSAFPNVFSSALAQGFGAFDNKKLVSFMGLVPWTLSIGSARVQGYSLGSVCTDAEYRGQGIASTLLSDVKRHVQKTGASMLFVSGDRSLYRRADCFPFGDMYFYNVTADASVLHRDGADLPHAIRGLAASDWTQLHRLHQNHPITFLQGVWELSTLIEAEPLASCLHMRHRVLVAEQDGCLLAFAVLAVPYRNQDDKSPIVIEYAGPPDVLLSLFRESLVLLELPSVTVPVNAFDTAMRETLTSLHETSGKNQGTVCVVNPNKLLVDLSPYLEEKNAEVAPSLRASIKGNGSITLSIGSQHVDMVPEEFVEFIFNSSPKQTWSDELEHLRTTLFPVPIPYTAGLNYV